jgi:asparagine synthase (glutamine-hydrolysing)
MGFCVVYGKDMHVEKGFKKDNETYYKVNLKTTPAPLVSIQTDEIIGIAIGDLFNYDIKKLLQEDWEINSDILLDKLGEFSFVKIDLKKNQIYFASSKTGIENLYYYYNKGVFLITDDFWEAINVIEPEREDICNQSLLESITYHYPTDYQTIISGLNWLPPATVGSFNINSAEINLKNYWEFKYKVQKDLTLTHAIERLDNLLDNAMKSIKEKFGDIEYGVGLSGGLDSRIIPYYALKNNMKLKAFIIGEKHPKSLLLSRDHKSARKIAQYFNIELIEIPVNNDGFKTQLENDISTYPLGPAALGKLVHKGIPSFDVLLTGGNGLILGSEMPPNIESMSVDELHQAIIQHCGINESISKGHKRASILLEYLFNIRNKSDSSKKMNNNFISDNFISEVNKKWKQYVLMKKNSGLTNLDIYEDYFNNHLGFRNRLGAFESLGGTKRSFSIYVPFIFNESLKWDISLLKDRKLLKSLVNEKMPEIAGVKLQSYHLAINKRKTNIIQRAITMMDFFLRGTGTGYLGGIKSRRFFNNLYKQVIDSNTKWFFSILDKDMCINIGKERNYRLMSTIMKRKRVIDIIEKREYDNYV